MTRRFGNSTPLTHDTVAGNRLLNGLNICDQPKEGVQKRSIASIRVYKSSQAVMDEENQSYTLRATSFEPNMDRRSDLFL